MTSHVTHVGGLGASARPGPASEDFWAPRLRAGGSTSIPRWDGVQDPDGGAEDGSDSVGTHLEVVPADLVRGIEDLAERLDVSPEAFVLAAHARVLGALTGEDDVVVGLAGSQDAAAVPVHLSCGSGSWTDLLLVAERRIRDVLAHPVGDLAALAARLDVALPEFETAVVLSRATATPRDGVLLTVTMTEGALRIAYRRSALDPSAVARIAGYHLRALSAAVGWPGASPQANQLLSAEELDLQLRGLRGPARTLPDVRPHRLIEERVRAHPDAVAAVHGTDQLSYAEVNARANRIARALLARGLQREDVVAVVTERNLDWLVCVLAVFKAGGVYLPIEPHFPADRIATTLRRSGSVLALSEAASTATLDVALVAVNSAGGSVAGGLPVERLLVAAALEEDHPAGDLDVEVTADQLAYIYFTSGSTGEPKGAMCEQAGFLNHLLAKIEDLGISEGDAVAQTAPQCFDISLWQLVSALLVGGRTVLVPQDVLLDVEVMVDRVVAERVAVLQVVPSYLEVVMTFLELHPRELPDLRTVSVTGEAVKMELVERWFAVQPGIALVNAYGLTETCDDTNHEVMHRPPAGSRVPLGRPIRNATVYILDPDLAPVPLGSPGEIVFSGVCVGRGYVNDPDRTALAFMDDPHVPGARLYRSGDFGRWRPDGTLDFLGRRDTQLKISGFRIEIGEIENTLLRAPGIRDAAVVVTDRPDGSRHLVGFYDAAEEIDPDRVQSLLASSLPHYMVPSTVHWRRGLPLSPNGKIDRKALTALAGELDEAQVSARTVRPPTTVSEVRVAAAWSRALGVDARDLGLDDNFFERGGTSLSAVKVVIGLKRAVSLKDVTAHPVLAELAAVLDGLSPVRTGLLQPLGSARQSGPARPVLVCLPHAGGNAVNFQPLAAALQAAGSDLAVWAVELPGHDLSGEREPFADVDVVVARVCAEVRSLVTSGVSLWGHSAGAVLALEVARSLEGQGIAVDRLFLGAQHAGTAQSRRAAALSLEVVSDADLAAGPAASGDLTEDDPERVAHLGAAYRHDVRTTCERLAQLLAEPSVRRVQAPVTAVVAVDDAATADACRRHGEWLAVAERVDLVELPHGGHHFLRTAPSSAAAAIVSSSAAGPPRAPAQSTPTPRNP